MRQDGARRTRPPISAWLRWGGLALAVAAGLALAMPTGRSVAAGEDACPEPNDQFQQACYLGTASDALGFLDRPGDVDAYRLEVLDFGVDVRAELAEMPFPYRLHLADWRGRIIGESHDEGGGQVIAARLGPPGSYYLFIDSRSGQVSDGEPYRVGVRLTYAIAAPNVLYSTEFRRPGEAHEFAGSNEWGTYHTETGRYHIDMRQGGDGDAAAVAWAYWGGPSTYGDFTFVVDGRVATPGVDGGYFISWRRLDDFEAYVLIVNPERREFLVRQFAREQQRTIVPQTPALVVNPAPEVNRIVVRAIGPEHWVNINGSEVAHFTDDALSEGRIGLGALSLGAPLSVVYDNIIVTSPAR